MAVRREKDAGVEVEINRVITPMLDLAFQVLLFFILTYHPSQLEEGQIDLTLPDAAQAQAASPRDAPPDPSLPGDLELPSEITVLVKTQHDGSQLGGISRISVQERQGSHDEPNSEALRKYLVGARTGLSNQNDIKIQADKGLRYAYVMEIVDVCNRAGFHNVSFGPPPDLQVGD
jgi:biopolymer transport protein ExbD